MRQFVRHVASPRLSAEAVDDLVLAAGEAFNNAVHHGRPEPDARIHVRALSADQGVELVFDYPGDPFEVEAQPDAPSPLQDRGRGRFLMELLVDQVRYRFNDGRTEVVLVKRMPRAN
jgi:anti-sigma regulatory factor (Ser/Thr protein kinase)